MPELRPEFPPAHGDAVPLPDRLLVCVTFFFVEERLRYLDRIAAHFAELARQVSVAVITNRADEPSLRKIGAVLAGKGFDFQIRTPMMIGHPYLLPWFHFDIVRAHIAEGVTSHFMYLEDDLLVTRRNIEYWMRGREMLRAANLVPSFLRVEQKDSDARFFSTDVTKRLGLSYLPQLKVSDEYTFLSLPQPYQGSYLLDRDLMLEHLSGASSNPDFGSWPIREKAAQGVTLLNVPRGFHSRNLVGYRLRERRIDQDCLIHHTPNTYANDPYSRFAKVPVDELVARSLIRHVLANRTASLRWRLVRARRPGP
jgi:hypothetical protein